MSAAFEPMKETETSFTIEIPIEEQRDLSNRIEQKQTKNKIISNKVIINSK